MIIRKIGTSFKSLFLLVILLIVFVLAALIGKVSLSKNFNSLMVQTSLINTASADVPGCSSCASCDGGDGGGGGCGSAGCS